MTCGAYPNKPRIANSIQNRLLRQNFLQIVNRTCPEVFRSLREHEIELIAGRLRTEDPTLLIRDFPYIEAGRLRPKLAGSANVWAMTYGVENTWVEQEAIELLDIWFRNPVLRSESPEYLPLSVASNSDLVEPTLDVSIPIPHALGFERPTFRWDTLENHLRARFADAMEEGIKRLKSEALRFGLLQEGKRIDLDSNKFTALALYLFRKVGIQEICVTPGLCQNRTTIWRWIKEVSTTVNLSEAVERRKHFKQAGIHRAARNSRSKNS